jgi:hypothetical protein
MSSSQSSQLLNILKTQLLLFLDELIGILPEEQDFVVMRFLAKDQVPITLVMEYIITHIVPLEPYVENKDERFFLNHNISFIDMADHGDKVDHFKRVWQASTDEEDKEMIWNWFHYFIQIGKKYQYLNP